MVARALVADAEVIGKQESGPDWRCQEPWVDGQHRTAQSSARDEKGPFRFGRICNYPKWMSPNCKHNMYASPFAFGG